MSALNVANFDTELASETVEDNAVVDPQLSATIQNQFREFTFPSVMLSRAASTK